MNIATRIGQALFALLGIAGVATALLASGCVIEPREGYYDREQHRWYHEHHWRGCEEREDHCRDR